MGAPALLRPGIVVAGSDIEIVFLRDSCGREWIAQREHPVTPQNPFE